MVKKRTNETNNAYTRLVMARHGIGSYKVIGKVTKIAAYALLTYGVTTSMLPSGSQLAILGGCYLLGIPFKVVMGKVKHYGKKVIYVLGVLVRPKRLRYEFKAWRLSLW